MSTLKGIDHGSVVVTPSRVAMEHNYGVALALINVGEAMPLSVERLGFVVEGGVEQNRYPDGSTSLVVVLQGEFCNWRRHPLPLDTEHHAIQSTTDTKETNTVTFPQEVLFFGYRSSERQTDCADVAQQFISVVVFRSVDSQCL